MLSQCLGSTLPGARWRHTEQEDREKGTLEYAEDHSASGNDTELESRSSVLQPIRRGQATSGVADVAVKIKLSIISCFMSLQFITMRVSSGCSVITNLFFPYLINFNVTEILYSL